MTRGCQQAGRQLRKRFRLGHPFPSFFSAIVRRWLQWQGGRGHKGRSRDAGRVGRSAAVRAAKCGGQPPLRSQASLGAKRFAGPHRAGCRPGPAPEPAGPVASYWGLSSNAERPDMVGALLLMFLFVGSNFIDQKCHKIMQKGEMFGLRAFFSIDHDGAGQDC